MKGSRSTYGFSLIEVLCAILILGIGLVGLVQGVTTALSSSKDSEVQTTAAFLAAGQMETLRADGLLVAGEQAGEYTQPFTRFRWRQTIAKTSIEGLYDVAIAIDQTKGGKTLFELKTMLFDSPRSSLDGEDRTGTGRKRRKGGLSP